MQGTGKTTAAGKLALYLKKQGLKVLLVATDVYRPGVRGTGSCTALAAVRDRQLYRSGCDALLPPAMLYCSGCAGSCPAAQLRMRAVVAVHLLLHTL